MSAQRGQWKEAGPGEHGGTLIEQEGFGIVCEIHDIEGESVHSILLAMNAQHDLHIACAFALGMLTAGRQEEARDMLYKALVKAAGIR